MARKFDGFKKAGFEVVAISSDKQVNLKRAYENFEGGFPFPLVADPDMSVFRQYRCYDDFEKAALHGTFLIDAKGLVRWQDISFEPFMDLDFLLKESIRLVGLASILLVLASQRLWLTISWLACWQPKASPNIRKEIKSCEPH